MRTIDTSKAIPLNSEKDIAIIEAMNKRLIAFKRTAKVKAFNSEQIAKQTLINT